MNNHNCFITGINAVDRDILEICWHNRNTPEFGSILFEVVSEKVEIDSVGLRKDFVKYILGLVVDQAEFVGESNEID